MNLRSLSPVALVFLVACSSPSNNAADSGGTVNGNDGSTTGGDASNNGTDASNNGTDANPTPSDAPGSDSGCNTVDPIRVPTVMKVCDEVFTPDLLAGMIGSTGSAAVCEIEGGSGLTDPTCENQIVRIFNSTPSEGSATQCQYQYASRSGTPGSWNANFYFRTGAQLDFGTYANFRAWCEADFPGSAQPGPLWRPIEGESATAHASPGTFVDVGRGGCYWDFVRGSAHEVWLIVQQSPQVAWSMWWGMSRNTFSDPDQTKMIAAANLLMCKISPNLF